MNVLTHRAYLASMTAIVVATFIGLIYLGTSYYYADIDQRFFHESHNLLKPSGSIGHGLGILGTFLMLSGVALYMLRKRIKKMARWGILKHWLEFHIFLCTLGPILILFHTAFKFGGVVAISFWSMVAVALSGVIGRFIYLQIPKSIEGRALSLNEIEDIRRTILNEINDTYPLPESILSKIINKQSSENNVFSDLKNEIKSLNLPKKENKKLLKLLKNERLTNESVV